MLTDAKRKAIEKYDKAHTLRIGLKLNIKTDADVIDRLNSVPNKQGYIKGLIRDDIRKEEP